MPIEKPWISSQMKSYSFSITCFLMELIWAHGHGPNQWNPERSYVKKINDFHGKRNHHLFIVLLSGGYLFNRKVMVIYLTEILTISSIN